MADAPPPAAAVPAAAHAPWQAARSGWLRCRQPRPHARQRLVCLPHAGGTANFYRDWPTGLPDHIELHAVQYPGREDRYAEACITDLHRLAALVTDALTPLRDRPLALFGHSMGAAIAHETARLLQQRGCPPVHLFVSGRPAPLHHRPGTIHRGSDAALVAELLRLGGTAPQALNDPELRALVLPSVRADYRAVETYEPAPGPTLSCTITAFTGTDDPEVEVSQAADWASYTSGSFALYPAPGGHFYLVARRREIIAHIVRRFGPDFTRDLP